MCYEFSRVCSDLLLKQIESIGDGNYFSICVSELNYLYSSSNVVAENIRGLLFLEQVLLHPLSEPEMASILRLPGTLEAQVLHGSKELYETFVERNTVQTA